MGTKFCQKTRVFKATLSEDFVILAYTALIQIQSVTDGQTNGWTPKPWLRRAKHSAVAHKNSASWARFKAMVTSSCGCASFSELVRNDSQRCNRNKEISK